MRSIQAEGPMFSLWYIKKVESTSSFLPHGDEEQTNCERVLANPLQLIQLPCGWSNIEAVGKFFAPTRAPLVRYQALLWDFMVRLPLSHGK